MEKLLIIGLASGLLLWRLGATSLVSWDEAWLTAVAQDMVNRGDFMMGFWNGQPWFYEPPLVTWILSLVLKIWGANEFWLRAWQAGLGVAIVWISGKITRELSRHKLAPVLAQMILLSNIEFLFRARQINTDIGLTLFILLAILASLKHQQGRAGIWLGLATLTKRASPLLAMPALAFILWRQKANKKAWVRVMTGWLMMVLPWLGWSWWRWGSEFWQKFFIGFTLGKITAVNPATGTSIWFYIGALKHSFKLWSLVLPIAMGWWLWKSKQKWRWQTVTVLLVTFGLGLTLAPIKASWYLIPTYPFLAIIMGIFLVEATKKYKYVVAMSCVAIAVLQIWQWRHDFIVPDTTRHQAEMAAAAGGLVGQDQPLYLDDDYLPVAVFYSQLHVIPLRFNRAPLPQLVNLVLPAKSIILSNKQNLDELRLRVGDVEELDRRGELVLVQVSTVESESR